MCSLKSGMDGISSNIKVRSIVGKYLEHSRIFYFENGRNPKVFLASADWMERNLNWRIETMFPIEDSDLKERVKEILDANLEDSIKARVQLPDGKYERIDRRGKKSFNSQHHFYNMAKESYLDAVEKEKSKVIKL